MTRKSPAAARRELLGRIQTEGAEAGYEAALAVARDPSAASPARATAAGLLLRAAGLLGSKPDDFKEKEASEMSYEELSEAIERMRVSDGDADNGDPGVFD